MTGERVLVVEDSDLLRRMYRDRLHADGYEVSTANDGLEALNFLRDATVDLVLLDLIMPRLGGMEVLETMHADPRMSSIPVIILTGLGEETVTERAISLGAYDFLVKSTAKPADVSNKIRLVLDAIGRQQGTVTSYKVYVTDHEGDADALVAAADLKRRFWCPACEVPIALELAPQPDRPGWYDAHFVCPGCGREH